MAELVQSVESALFPVVAGINTYLSNYVLVFLLIGVGMRYSIKTRFIQVRCFDQGMKKVFGNLSLRGGHQEQGMSSFQALATAIAAQVGTGNIMGASGAILAGGPVYYITTAFKGGFGKFLAGFFAVAIILALGFMGCMVQSNSIGSTFQTAFGSVFGASFGNIFVAVCLFFFAFSTILSWNLFGKINIVYLFGKNAAPVYSVIALVFIFLGTVTGSDFVWEVTDMFNNLMVIPNAIALFALTGMVVKSVDDASKNRLGK